MTQVGVSTYVPGPVTVTSVGTNVWDGWVKVSGIDGTALPGGTGDWGFFVTANLCNVSSPQTSTVALIEVGIGTAGVPFFDTIQAVRFDGTLLFQRTGVPYTQCWVAAASGRGAWNSSNNFELYARISQNGGTTAAGGFQVADIVMHAFAFDRLANTVHGSQDAGSVSYGGSPNQGTVFGNWITSAVDRDYLAFWSINYYPNPNARTRAAIAWEYMPDKTVANHGVTPPITYWMQRAAIGVAFKDRGPNQVGNARWGDGGFAYLQASVSDPDPGVRFHALATVTAGADDAGLYLGGDWFLVDSLEVGNFKQITIAADDNLHNDGGVPLQNVTVEGHEFTRTFFADVEYVYAMEPLVDFPFGGDAQPLTNPYRQCVKLNSGAQPKFDYAAQCRTNEPFLTVSGTHFDTLQANEIRFDLFGWATNATTVKRRLTREIRAMQWDWNDDPQVTPSQAPAPGPVSWIHPGYEGLATGSLTELPVAPSEVGDVQDFDPKHRIETDLGYQPTWPAFTTWRRTATLRWSGLTALERDTLAAFFSATGTRAFKFTDPIDGVGAWVARGPMQTTETQTRHTCSIDVVELKFQAP